MTYTPTNWVDGATPLNRTNMMRIENELALLDGPAPSTTPPGSPVDGQIWYYPPGGGGACWQFRYNPSGAAPYLWEFIGGPAFAPGPSGSITTTGNNVDLTGGPTATIPRSGGYLVHWGAFIQAMPGSSQINLTVGPSFSAAGVSSIVAQFVAPGVTTYAAASVSSRGSFILTGGETVKLVCTANGQSTQFQNGWIDITPIRVS